MQTEDSPKPGRIRSARAGQRDVPANSFPGRLAKQGMKTADIKRKYVGGSCQNIACLPSKNVVHSAKVASYFRRSEEFGIAKDNWKINMSAVCERKRKMVSALVDVQLDLYKESGAELDRGLRTLCWT